MDTVSDVADAAFDVVAPVNDVPHSVDSTTLGQAATLEGCSADSCVDQVQLVELIVAPGIVPDSITDQIYDVELVQVPSIGSVVEDVVSDMSEEEAGSEDLEEDEFIPRGHADHPGAGPTKLPLPPKADKSPAGQSPAASQQLPAAAPSKLKTQTKTDSKKARTGSGLTAGPPGKKYLVE